MDLGMSNKTKLVNNSQKFVQPSQCREPLSEPESCKKCLAEDARQKRSFKNHRAIFHHYVICHSGIDYDVEPTLEYCIQQLVSACQQCQEENKH